MVQHDVIAGVAADARDRAQGQALADPWPAAMALRDDERGQADGPRGDGDALVGERPMERAERADEKEVEEDEEHDAYAPEQDREGDLHLAVEADDELRAAAGDAGLVGEDHLGAA